MTAVLYAIPASHPCAAVERALQLKGIAYRRVEMIPVAHRAAQLARFGTRTVPGLELEDGTRVAGSRPILRELEARVPAPALLPADERERARVELAEEWGDEVLQPLARRLVWAGLRRKPGAVTSYGEGAELPVPAWVARLSAPLVAQAAARVNGAADPDVRADLLHLDSHLRRVEGWIDDARLGSAAPNAADLQIGAGVRLLQTLGDLRPGLDSRPAGALARRWFPDYPGDVPAGTLPAAWITAAPAA
jgi:glutathione S-transferase